MTYGDLRVGTLYYNERWNRLFLYVGGPAKRFLWANATSFGLTKLYPTSGFLSLLREV